jgi:thiamine-phosphate pyrophosphorylase
MSAGFAAVAIVKSQRMVLPRLYAILEARFFAEASALCAAAEELASAGVTLIQYRSKSHNARVVLEQARELRRRLLSHPNGAKDAPLGWGTRTQDQYSHPSAKNAEGWGTQAGNPHPVAKNATRLGQPVRLIMNDRADLALIAEFDGVHVGQEDLSPESVRRIIGGNRWLGVSTHNPAQLAEADKTSADYLAIGPVFSTSTKEKPDPVVGLEGVRRARQLTRKTLVAIGGITRQNAVSVIEAGADSVAVISDLLREPRKSAEEFLRILS